MLGLESLYGPTMDNGNAPATKADVAALDQKLTGFDHGLTGFEQKLVALYERLWLTRSE